MNIEDIPLEERQKRAGEELAAAAATDPFDSMSPSVLGMMRIMRKWNVDSVIWPENMGSNLKALRCE